jgi:leucyl aminopeptidase
VSAAPRIEAKKGDFAALQADVGIVYKFKGDPALPGPVDQALAQRLVEVAKEDRFEGGAGRHMLWHAAPGDGLRCRRYLLVECDRLGIASVALPLLPAGAMPFPAREAAAALTEGALLGTYRFDRYRSEPRAGRRHLREIQVAAGDAPLRDVTDGISFGETTSSATNFARDLVNEPAGELFPMKMAEIARQVA